jgi:8-oxo-dGTP pyrophosphatase MutT (NUDIX family)
VKALIIHDGQLLTIEKFSGDCKRYVIPGGGQEVNETLADAVIRECLEELGVKVKVGPLLWVREFISKNHISNQKQDEQTHIVEHIFEAVLDEIPDCFEPISADSSQTGVVWLPIDKLSNYNYYPKELIPLIQRRDQGESIGESYVGDIN